MGNTDSPVTFLHSDANQWPPYKKRPLDSSVVKSQYESFRNAGMFWDGSSKAKEKKDEM